MRTTLTLAAALLLLGCPPTAPPGGPPPKACADAGAGKAGDPCATDCDCQGTACGTLTSPDGGEAKVCAAR